jgi:hypothetical protein
MQNQPVNLSPGSASARAIFSDGSQAKIKVFTYNELVAEEKRRQTMRAIGVALAGAGRAMEAANAGYTSTTGSFNAYGSNGVSAYGSYQSSSYSNYQAFTAQQLASAQTSADFASIRAEGQYNLAALSATIMKDHTLMPGEWYGGLIVLDTPPKGRNGAVSYVISFALDGDVHEFQVHQSKV